MFHHVLCVQLVWPWITYPDQVPHWRVIPVFSSHLLSIVSQVLICVYVVVLDLTVLDGYHIYPHLKFRKAARHYQNYCFSKTGSLIKYTMRLCASHNCICHLSMKSFLNCQRWKWQIVRYFAMFIRLTLHGSCIARIIIENWKKYNNFYERISPI